MTVFFFSLPIVQGKDFSKRIGIAYPPLKNEKQRAFSKSHLSALKVKRLRFSEHWNFREPKRGQYKWSPLDERIGFANKLNIEVMLTIEADGPGWAMEEHENHRCFVSQKDAFKKYVRNLLKRYSHRIAAIQFGNEWDSEKNFPCDINQYVEYNNILYDLTKQLSPKTLVILGGITRGYAISNLLAMGEELSLSGMNIKNRDLIPKFRKKAASKAKALKERVEYVFKNARYDRVDVHLYDDCENWAKYIDFVRKVVSKPIIVSEFGGPHHRFEIYSEDYQAKRLEKYLSVIKELPIETALFFKLVESEACFHPTSALIDKHRNKKKAYKVFLQR